MSLSPQWLDELRSRVSLSGLIGRTVRVRKAGREFKACCPFHNEKSPSFTINDDKGFYHCFGCGAHGDAIRWLTDHQGLEFLDAVRELASIAGMELPAPDPRAAQRREEERSLYDVMAAAQAFFRAELAGERGAEARAYLATRGFPGPVIDSFGFGFAPDTRGALKSALGAFPEAMLIEAGLVIVVEEREPYDRFRGRLTLPICDQRGRVIAFGGRILGQKESGGAPKYLNSPDTPLFDKGRTLYNLHRAAPAARRSGRLVVVEGYMDAVALAGAGIVEAVAPLGTALTEDQIERLWQVVPVPILCFDGDAAGRRAAHRAMLRALPLLRPGHSLGICTLPAGMDPDDIVRRDGPGGIEALLGAAPSLIDALWESERDALPLDTPEAKAGLKQRLIDHADTIRDPDIRALYRRALTERYGEFAFARRPQEARHAPRRSGERWSGNGRRPGYVPAPPPVSPETTARLRQRVGSGDALLAAVLAGLVAHPGEIARHGESLAHLAPADPAMAALLDVLIALADSPGLLENGDLATILAGRQVRVPSSEDYAGLRFAFLGGGSAPAELAEAIALLVELPRVEAALADATQRHETEFSEESFAEQQRLLQRKLALLARLMQMGRARAAL